MTGLLILASSSVSRQHLLKAAGVRFRVVPPSVNEEKESKALRAEGAAPSKIAETLAELKAKGVSVAFPDAFVLGADQLLVCQDVIYEKAVDEDSARHVLRALRGREHQLITAAVLAKNGALLWRHSETAKLSMRDFSDAFLDSYIASQGEALFDVVGCYHVEGAGAQLFTRIEGDYFAIQGLPLLPLFEALREYEAITE